MAFLALTLKDWLCTFCACFNFALTMTLLISMNVLFTDWLNYFGASRSETTAVQASGFGIMLGAGVIAGMLETRLGSRVCLLLGAVLAAGGYLAGAFVTSLPALIVSVGVVTGYGSCLLHLSTLSTGVRRFPRKAASVSLAMACVSSLAHLATPLIYRYLSEHYTWRGCLVIASGVILNTCVSSLLLTSPLLRPQLNHLQPGPDCPSPRRHDINAPVVLADVTLSSDDVSKGNNESGACQIRLLSNDPGPSASGDDEEIIDGAHSSTDHRGAVHKHNRDEKTVLSPSTESDCYLREQKRCLAQDWKDRDPADTHECPNRDGSNKDDSSWPAMFKSILTDPLYLAILLCTVTYLGAGISFVVLVLDLAIHKGWSEEDGVFLNFSFQLSGLVSRALLGAVSLHGRVRGVALLNLSAAIGSIGLIFVGQVPQFSMAAVCYGALGMGYGGVVGLFPAAVLEVVGQGRVYPVALGLMCTVEGVLDAMTVTLTGWLVDVLQSYRVTSLVYGLVSLATCILLLFVSLYRRHRRKHAPRS